MCYLTKNRKSATFIKKSWFTMNVILETLRGKNDVQIHLMIHL